jgi:cyclic pyranopterin phosphate synthase
VVARSVGFHRVRLNALNIRDLPETEMLDLVKFARQQRFELRFIEFMPLDAEQAWNRESVLSGAEMRRRIEAEFGQLLPVDRDDISQPAVDFQFADGQGRIGFINPVTEPFCGNCNRLRLTAEGQFRNCLFSTEEWDVRALLRSDASDDQVKELLAECVRAKQPGHLIDQDEFERPVRAMYQIGG